MEVDNTTVTEYFITLTRRPVGIAGHSGPFLIQCMPIPKVKPKQKETRQSDVIHLNVFLFPWNTVLHKPQTVEKHKAGVLLWTENVVRTVPAAS